MHRKRSPGTQILASFCMEKTNIALVVRRLCAACVFAARWPLCGTLKQSVGDCRTLPHKNAFDFLVLQISKRRIANQVKDLLK